MIPLSDWLAIRDIRVDTAAGPLAGKACDESGAEDEREADRARQIREAEEAGRKAGLADGFREVEAVRQELSSRFQIEREQLETAWAQRCAAVTASSIIPAFDQLRETIERALCSALRPLLHEAVREKALEILHQLINDEIGHRDRKLVEVRAPSTMHERLRSEFDRAGLQILLTESETVEVACHGDVAVFESLAARWIDEVRKAVDE